MKSAIVLLFLLGGIASAQYDPGIRDSVSFGPWEAIVPADSPWSGNIRVPVRVFYDEFLNQISLVFDYTGPWKPVGVRLTDKDFYYDADLDYLGSSIIYIFAVTPLQRYAPPDSGVFAYLCFAVEDTGQVTVDAGYTFTQEITYFFDGHGVIAPDFLQLQDIIQPTVFPAGDVNADTALTLADIIALANFVFKSSFSPPILNLCDVNADCRVDIVDVVYLLNVILRSRFVAKYGCIC